MLINRYQSRQFLKPWWKTIFEFENFMARHFYDDSLRKQLCDLIYYGGKNGMPASEFRSQLAKHVKYIMQQLFQAGVVCANLNDDDFFIVERSVRFFDIDTIEQLNIALHTNEIVGKLSENTKELSGAADYPVSLTGHEENEQQTVYLPCKVTAVTENEDIYIPLSQAQELCSEIGEPLKITKIYLKVNGKMNLEKAKKLFE